MASFSPINAQIIALVAEQVKKQDPNAGLRPGETVQVTSSGPGQATAVAVPAPSSAPATLKPVEGSTIRGSVLPGDPYYQSPEYRAYQERLGSGPRIGTADIYDSPYFGRFGSGSFGRAADDAYRQYLERTRAASAPPSSPASAPAPRSTGQFIYNQYRRPAAPRMMFEGLPSLLERFRMQPSAQQQQQQYPMPPRFRFAEGGEATTPKPSTAFGIKDILRKIRETQNVQDALPREAATVASPQLGIKNMIRRIQAAQNPDAIAPPSEPSIRSPIAGIKGLLSKIRQRALEQNQEPASTPRPKMEDFLPQARFSFDASTSPLLPLQQVMYTQPTYRSYTSPRPNPVVMPQGSDALSMFLKNRRML